MSDTPTTGFHQLPDEAFVREWQLIRSERCPSGPLPFSTPTLWRRVRDGSFPRPVKLSSRVTAWRVGDVRRWLAIQLSQDDGRLT